MKPELPPAASYPVDRISVATWRKIRDCLAYAMEHPRGDGVTVLNQPGGTLRALRPPAGGSGTASDPGYAGFFKVIDATGEDGIFKVRVVNGADPENPICGTTDLGEIEAATLTPASGHTSVILALEWTGEAYRQTLQTYSRGAPRAKEYLASFDSTRRTVTQLWTGGVINFGARYFL